MIARFPNTAPSTTSASLSPTHSQSLSDLLSFSHPLLPHTSHLSLLHSERPIWESVRSAYVCACVSVTGAVAHQGLTNPLSISHLCFWLEVRYSEKLALRAWELDLSLKKLEEFIFWRQEWMLLGWDNSVKWLIIFHQLWLSGTWINDKIHERITHHQSNVREWRSVHNVIVSQFSWVQVRQHIFIRIIRWLNWNRMPIGKKIHGQD